MDEVVNLLEEPEAGLALVPGSARGKCSVVLEQAGIRGRFGVNSGLSPDSRFRRSDGVRPWMVFGSCVI